MWHIISDILNVIEHAVFGTIIFLSGALWLAWRKMKKFFDGE